MKREQLGGSPTRRLHLPTLSSFASNSPTELIPTRTYAAGDSWRTRLLGVTDSTTDVEAAELLAPGADPVEGRLTMKLTDFEPLPTSWAGEGLFQTSNGTPVEESFAQLQSRTG